MRLSIIDSPETEVNICFYYIIEIQLVILPGTYFPPLHTSTSWARVFWSYLLAIVKSFFFKDSSCLACSTFFTSLHILYIILYCCIFINFIVGFNLVCPLNLKARMFSMTCPTQIACGTGCLIILAYLFTHHETSHGFSSIMLSFSCVSLHAGAKALSKQYKASNFIV